MRIALAVFSVFLLTSCLPTESNPGHLQKACTLIATVSQVRVDLGNSADRPAFLAAVVDDTVTVDECDTGADNFSPAIYRHQGKAYLVTPPYHKQVNGAATEEYDLERKMNLKLYGRASCGDALQALAQNSELEIKWSQDYPNGHDCGAAGFIGEAELKD